MNHVTITVEDYKNVVNDSDANGTHFIDEILGDEANQPYDIQVVDQDSGHVIGSFNSYNPPE